MDSKKPLYKYKTFWVLFLFLLYSSLGFFAVPYLIKKELSEITINQLNSKITIEKAHFNPFTIAAKIDGVKVSDLDSTLWLSADNIYLNVNLWDTLFNHLSFDKLQINNPYYYLMLEDNSSNQVKYPKIVQTEPNPGETALELDIASININKGAVKFLDSTSEKQVNLDLREISFNHDSFTTLDMDSRFSLSFVTIKDEKAQIDGSFNLAQSKFNLNWSIDNFTTETIFHIAGDTSDTINSIKNKSGKFNATGTLISQSDLDKLPALTISNFTLQDFSNETEDDLQLFTSIPNLSIVNTRIDLDEQLITIETANADSSKLSVSFDEGSHLIFHQSNVENEANNDNKKGWNYSINEINLTQSVLNVNKIKNEETGKNVLNFENIKISNLSNLENQTIAIFAKTLVDSEGLFELSTQLNLEPLELTNSIKFSDINISKWQSWIPNDLLLNVESGLMSFEQDLVYKNDNFVSDGWFKFNNLKLTDQNNQPFFSINQLDLKQAKINSNSKSISLNNIILDNAQGDLIVTEDKQLNVNNLLPNSEEEQIIEQKPTEKNNLEQDGWIINIQEVELIDAKSSLTDKSIKPNYQTELSKINGKIKGLSSDNLSKADVNLSGLLDTYGKLKIDGQINPLSEKAFTDISINVENLDLQNFSSYSGQYLGFPITRGKLDFELNYKLNQSLLKGINDLSFKQLQFGDKTDSKDAVSLPLKLAVGLLTDGNGIMVINLPVSGNIDDPEFSYGGIVFKAFFKLITGIVASPFKLLGKLIPGGADLDLSGIQFQAGIAILQDQEQVKLEAMKKILEQRPGILLELSGVVNTINDTKAIQLQQLLTKLNTQEKPEFTLEYNVNPIKTLYIKSFSPEKWQQLESNSTKDEVLNIQLLAENAFNELLENEKTEEKLNLLAKERALFIQSQLIENYGVSQDKIYIKPFELSEELYPQVKFGVGE